MAIKHYKPTTNGRRGMSTLANEEITTSTPTKSLLASKSKTGGRNNQGKMTVRHIGGGAKRKYRVIDYKRNKVGVTGRVATIEYDPNRNANIALINYKDGEKRYIIAPNGLKVGMIIENGESADIKVGNALPLKIFQLVPWFIVLNYNLVKVLKFVEVLELELKYLDVKVNM